MVTRIAVKNGYRPRWEPRHSARFLGQTPKTLEDLITRPAGANLQDLQKGLLQFESKDEALTYAAYLITQTGLMIADQLWKTYEQYKDIGSYWLAEAAAVGVATFPVAAITVPIDVFWQASRQNEAVLKLEAVNKIAVAWMNDMADRLLPAFMDDFDKSTATIAVHGESMKLGDAVSYVFDRVQQANANVVQKLSGVNMLPPSVISAAIKSFFGTLTKGIQENAAVLLEIMRALAKLTQAGLEAAGTLAKLTAAAPYVVLGVVGIAAAYFIVK